MNLQRAARSTAIRLAVVLAVAWVGAGHLPEATAAGLVRHRDAAHKFSFYLLDDWSPVPLQPDERDVVAEFVQGGGDARGTLPARLTMFRAGPDGAVVTQSDDDPRRPSGMPRPTTVFDMWKQRIELYQMKPLPDASAGKPIKSKDDVPGKIWVHETSPDPRGGSRSTFHVFASWKKPDSPVEYGMWMACASAQRKKLETSFLQFARSFQWFDAKAKDVKSIDALTGVNITPARRRAIERGLVKGWGVVVSPKKNYVVIYNTKGRRNDALAKLIAERVELIREQIYEKNFPPARPFDDVAIVRVCGDRSEYHAYGGPGGSAGYWSPGSEELVFYDASPADKVDDNTIAVLYHEAFHQYIYYSAGRVAPHSWFDEGHGDYYAGARLVGSKFTIRPFAWRVGTIKNALHAGPSPKDEKGQFDRRRDGYTPLPDFTAFSQAEYYSYARVCYAQGWSFIYFLREIVPNKPAWNAKWGKILDTYFTTLRGSVAAAEPKKPVPSPEPASKPGPDGKPVPPVPPASTPDVPPLPPARTPDVPPASAPFAPFGEPAVPRFEFEALYAIPWLVPDAVLAQAWKKFPNQQPDEAAAWTRFRNGVGLAYVVTEGESKDGPAIDPRDPEKGFAAYLRRDLIGTGVLGADTTGWPVPAPESFGERGAAPAPGAVGLPDPSADPLYRTYLEKGWRSVALRDQFFANLLDHLLKTARESVGANPAAGPDGHKTFSAQLAALADLEPSAADAAKGGRFLRSFATKPGEGLDRKQIESLPELGSYVLPGYLAGMNDGSYDAVPQSLRAGEILVALRLGRSVAGATAPEPVIPDPPDAKPPQDDAKPEDAQGYVPPPSYAGGGDLKKALEAAFRGVDWKELEAAWKDSIGSVGSR